MNRGVEFRMEYPPLSGIVAVVLVDDLAVVSDSRLIVVVEHRAVGVVLAVVVVLVDLEHPTHKCVYRYTTFLDTLLILHQF